MFKRSRRKIVLAVTGSLLLLFAVTLSVILLASYREVRQRNMDLLERYAELFRLDTEAESASPPDAPPEPDRQSAAAPDGRPEGPDGPEGMKRPGKPPLDQGPDYRLSTFYSVVLDDAGEVRAIDNGEKDVYSEEELTQLARELQSAAQTSGRLGNLSYVVSTRPEYTLVAFMDTTVSESSLSTLLRYVLIIGGAAILVMFLVSLELSRRIVRPLEENDRNQKQFISDASHELKTPVAVISANAELLSREIGDNEWLAAIQYENDRMDGLIRQLLDLSRAENAEVPMEPVDFSRVVTGEALALETLAFDQGRTIQSEIDDGITLTGNPTQLTQVVSVLLDNAIRHAKGGEIRLSLKRQGHLAVLSVINDGAPIPPEKMARLFDRFYRLDEARTGEDRHYGLGLAIAKAVTEKHGGSLEVSCRDGKIRFSASFPIRK